MNYAETAEFSVIACDSYEWNSQTYTTSGDYTQTFTNAEGCDSVVTLHLTVNYAETAEFSVIVCDSYEWNGQTYTSSGNYTQTFTNAEGCDSVVTLHLTVNYAETAEFSIIVCDSYEWNGQTYTTSGNYTQTFTNAEGCDSVVTLQLTVNYAETAEFAVIVCDSYEWNGQTYTSSGNYTQTFTNAEGCDSVVTLHLTVNYAETAEFSVIVCDSYEWNGQTYTSSGNYTQTFTNAEGCDSVVTLHLTINPSVTGYVEVTANISYEWNGQTYTTSGDYTQTFETVLGCDSIVTLHLTVNQIPNGDAQPCPGHETVTDYDGNVYNTVKIGDQCWLKENLRTAHYADGMEIAMGSTTSNNIPYRYYPNNDANNVATYGYLYNWVATMRGMASSTTNPSNIQGICPTGWHVPSDAEWTQLTDYVSSVPAYWCSGGSNNIAKALASTEGWNTNTNNCAIGNDLATNNASGFSAVPAGTCNGLSFYNMDGYAYFWSSTEKSSGKAWRRSLSYNIASMERNSGSTYYGRSVRCLLGDGENLSTVTTSPVSNIALTSATCGGNVIYDGNSDVTARGVCWSTSPNPTVNDSHTSNGSGTGAFTSNLTGLTPNTTYYVRAYATNNAGTSYGDEVSFTTDPEIIPSWVIISGESTVCDNATTTLTATSDVAGNYTWSNGMMGQTVTVGAGIYTVTVTSGTDNTLASNPFTVFPAQSVSTDFNATVCDSYEWNGQTYTESGNYTQTFETVHGCDSIVTLHLTVNPSVTGYVEVTANISYEWNGQTYTESGDYTQTFETVHGCDSVVTLHLTVNQIPAGDALPCPGNETVTDYDGNVYNTVKLGQQCWMKENLKTTHYADGTEITLGNSATLSNTVPYRYSPNFDANNVSSYGYLYNWVATMRGMEGTNNNPSGVQGVCPTGWHIPSNAEWTQLTDYVNSVPAYSCNGVSSSIISKSLASTFGWRSSGLNCVPGNDQSTNNLTGYNAIPAGGNGGFSNGFYVWSASVISSTNAIGRDISYNQPTVVYVERTYNDTRTVRCLLGDGINLSTVTTSPASDVTLTSATCGGNVTYDGNTTVTARGVCWSTSQNPTVADAHTTDGSGTGTFTSSITDLTTNTTYYVRAYATNSAGTSYGNEVSFTTESVPEPIEDEKSCPGTPTVTDVDGNTYSTVLIGNQCWMRENLRTTHYADGTVIPAGENAISYTTSYYYDNSSLDLPLETRGYLYNWAAAMHGAASSGSNPSGVQGICPAGWHLPSDAELNIMESTQTTMDLSSSGWRGDHAGRLSGEGWNTSTTAGAPGNASDTTTHNVSGFSAVPTGSCFGSSFYDANIDASFWSSTEYSNNNAWGRNLNYDNAYVGRHFYNKRDGRSVRCLRDSVYCGNQGEALLSDTIFMQLCQGETFYWHGMTIETTGYYADTLQNIVGCDSVMNVLFLIVEQVPQVQVQDATICKCDLFSQNSLEELVTLDDTLGHGVVGVRLEWSTSVTGPWYMTAPTPPSTVGVYHYYVRQTNIYQTIECTGPAAEITLIIREIPVPQVTGGPYEFYNNSDELTTTLTVTRGNDDCSTTSIWFLNGDSVYTGDAYTVNLADIRPTNNVDTTVTFLVRAYNAENYCYSDFNSVNVVFHQTLQITYIGEAHFDTAWVTEGCYFFVRDFTHYVTPSTIDNTFGVDFNSLVIWQMPLAGTLLTEETPVSVYIMTPSGEDTAVIQNMFWNIPGEMISVTALVEPSQGCSPATFNFTAIPENAAGTVYYTWTKGTLTMSNEQSFSCTETIEAGQAESFYTFTVEATDQAGCTATSSVQVLVSDTLSFSVTATPNTLCGGENFNGELAFLKPDILYSISNANGEILYYGLNGHLTNLPAGLYTIHGLDVTTGCENTVTAMVMDNTQNPVFTVTVNPNQYCDNEENIVNGSVTIDGSSASIHQLFHAVTGNPTEWEEIYEFNHLPAGHYKVTATNDNGCQTEREFNINNNQIVPVVIAEAEGTSSSNPTNMAYNGKVKIRITNYVVNSMPYTIILDTVDNDGNVHTVASNSNANQLTTFTGLGAGTYRYKVTDKFFCTDSGEIVVGTNRPCTASATHPAQTGSDYQGNGHNGANSGLETVDGVGRINSVTDYDGNEYPVVQIGNQCWIRENVRTTHFADGTAIPVGGGETSYTDPYYYVNTSLDAITYGYLYNWPAAMAACPMGWHLPSDAEWTQLSDYVSSQPEYICGGDNSYIAKALTSTEGWTTSTNNCAVGNDQATNNASGFSAVPAGTCNGSSFYNTDGYAYFWSSTEKSSNNAWRRSLSYNNASMERHSGSTYYGRSVRCLRDESSTSASLPTVVTGTVSDITGTTAIGGGEVTTNGGAAVTARGVCWSTSQNPTVADAHTEDGSGTGAFTSSITGLTPNTTYYVRAYATNSAGTAYGEEVSFTTVSGIPAGDAQPCPNNPTVTDYDGNVYNTVKIGDQCWMKENLRVTHYADGTEIPYSDASTLSSDIAYRYAPNGDINNIPVFGCLYNWPAVMHGNNSNNDNPSIVQGVCPQGWHMPSELEWTQLLNYVSSIPYYQCGGNSSHITKALSSQYYWLETTEDCRVGTNPTTNNATGFSALPASYVSDGNGYAYFGYDASFWSCTQYDLSRGKCKRIWSQYSAGMYYDMNLTKLHALAVRCLLGDGVNLSAVTTAAASEITSNSATCGGNVTYDGNTTVTARGVCWSTSQNPTVADAHTEDGSGTGAFTSSITGLTPNTTYYVRAYATNSAGTAYGEEVSFTTVSGIPAGDAQPCPNNPTVTDYDGNVYNTVKLGDQCWMKENLKTTHYADGTEITLGNSATLSNTVPYRYSPNFDANNVSSYGYLYNWVATMRGMEGTNNNPSGVQGVCPTGWHIPSNAEWTQLTDYVSSVPAYSCNGVSSSISKSLAATFGWRSSSSNCVPGNDQSLNNLTGYNAIPAGGNGGFSSGFYVWSASVISSTIAIGRDISYNQPTVVYVERPYNDTRTVRCLLGDGVNLSTVTTAAASEITSNSATCGGNVTYDGNTTVTARGVCWSTSQNPTVADAHTEDGSGTGAFTSSITGLTPNTTYYVRAYATNSAGTAYGEEVSFTTVSGIPAGDAQPCPNNPTVTDYDGNVYNTVKLGDQCWMKENLRVTHYADGTAIPAGGDNVSNTEPYYYDYSSHSLLLETRGYLYNWPAAMHDAASSGANPSGVQGICPTGWHLPSDAEWTQLTDYMGSVSEYQCGGSSGNIAKALASETGWISSTGTCAVGNYPTSNNASGFSAVPAGICDGSTFAFAGEHAIFWSSTEFSSNKAWYRDLYYDYANVDRVYYIKLNGRSVRCLLGDGVNLSTVTTAAASEITSNSATCGGNVTYDGNTTVTARGVCWSTSQNPTVADAHTEDGSGTGAFTSSITGLTPNTTYYVRAYATNSVGTSYGEEVSFTTTDEIPSCYITFMMHDSYGDGWNGNTILVYNNNTVQNVTLDYGSDGTVSVPVYNGALELEWVNGYWPDECSFTVVGPSCFHYSGNAPGQGVFLTTELDCTGSAPAIPSFSFLYWEICDAVGVAIENLSQNYDYCFLQITDVNADSLLFSSSDYVYYWDEIHYAFTTSGIYDVTLIAGNYDCPESVQHTETLYLTVPEPIAVTIDTAVCASELPLYWHGMSLFESGTYTDTTQASDGCPMIVTLNLYVQPLPNIAFSPDAEIEAGGYVDLWASGMTDFYWLDSDMNLLAIGDSIFVNPTETTTYWLNGRTNPNNLVFNGDFELGNTGFTTDYNYVGNGVWGNYYIGHENHEMWSWDTGDNLFDHTSGSGMYMMVDAYPNYNIWLQTVNVTPNTDYVFSAWFLTDNMANVKFEINEVSGELFNTPQHRGIWERRQFIWNSGESTTATLKITTGSADYGGYDFGIDDIYFGELNCEIYVPITVNVFQSGVNPPAVSTGAAKQTGNSNAYCSGEVTSDGGATVTDRGICWSTSPNPTLNDSYTSAGTDTGSFTADLTNLNVGTTYYIRAYATNSAGTVYGGNAELTLYLVVPKTGTEVFDMTDTEITVYDHAGPYDYYDDYCDGSLVITAPNATDMLVITGSFYVENSYDKIYIYDGYGTDNLLAELTNKSVFTVFPPITTTQNTVTIRFTSDYVITRSGFELHVAAEPCLINVVIDSIVCESEFPLIWKGQTITEMGTYTASKQDANGCDTTFILTVRSSPYFLNDDFNDGVIDIAKWTYTGNIVFEEDGLLKLQQNNTDQDVHLRTVDMGVPASGKVAMDRKFMVHRDNNYYYGSAYYHLNGVNNNNYIGIQYNYGQYEGWYGTHLVYKLNGSANETRIWLCDATFDTWITEHVELDFSAGTLSYYLDTLVATVSIPDLSSLPVDYYNVQFNPYGWWTGHQHFMDWVDIYGDYGLVNTSAVSGITATSATCGGNVASDDCISFGSRGVCWSTSQNPTVADAHTEDGSGTGAFTSSITGLTPNTTYYVRAYVTNSAGTSYGEEVSFTTLSIPPGDAQPCPGTPTVTDYDGNVYNTVQIGDQCWMRENLRTTHYADGTPIPAGGDATSNTDPYYYNFSSHSLPLETRGFLYNWPAATVACPTGWHLPSDAEWTQLSDYVSSVPDYQCNNNSIYIAKALASSEGWNTNTNNCAVGNDQATNNVSGFAAAPAGDCHGESFGNAGTDAYFWSSTEYDTARAWRRFLNYNEPNVLRTCDIQRYYGFSVRCLRD